MKTLRRAWSRLRGAFFGRRRDPDLADELESHIAMLADDYMRSGMSPEQARRAAVLKIGGVEPTKESVRDQRGLPLLESAASDVRYGLRGLRRNPGFATAAILSVALGIGATTAIFSVVHAVLLRPLPYADPEQLYSVEVVIPERANQIESLPVTIQAYLDWRATETVFSSIAALRPWEGNLAGDGEPERLGGARVSADFFSTLGVPLERGRGFAAEEEEPGRENVVVISDALWRRRYGADPAAVGKEIRINETSHRIVGIAPASMLAPTGSLLHRFVAFAPRIDLWKPIAPTPRELENESWDHGVLVRLGPGESLEQGRLQLERSLNALMRAQAPGLDMELLVRLRPIRDIYAGKARRGLLLVLGAAMILLLTACVNIANLFLARMGGRAGELATRIALGAGRARIVRQILTESIVVALLGGALGGVLAYYGAGLLAAYGPDEVRLLSGRPWNAAVLLFTAAASTLTGLACGLLPALHAYRRDVAAELQESGKKTMSGARAGLSRQVLAGVEMALATALLASAGLLLHSFVRIMKADRGYQVEQALAVDLSLFGARYSTGESRVELYREVSRRVRGLPGVLAAGAISELAAAPAAVGASQTIFYSTDTDFESAVLQRPVAMIRSVASGYFAASMTPLRAGRFFDDHEDELAAILSESLANRLWPGESAASIVGRTLRQGRVTGTLIRVVGVAADVRAGAADEALLPFIYRPHAQWASGPMSLVVRTDRDPAALAAPVRAEIRALDPNLPIPSIRTMREIVSASVAQRRFQMTLTALFALAAVLLGAVGVYGVVSYSVACRTREVGLRIALGAMRRDIFVWIFARGMLPVLSGLLAGMAGAVGLAVSLRSLLFEITPTDPVTLGAVAVILLSASGLACYVPARRAARLDPLAALRHE